jgi:hypothetical protein
MEFEKVFKNIFKGKVGKRARWQKNFIKLKILNLRTRSGTCTISLVLKFFSTDEENSLLHKILWSSNPNPQCSSGLWKNKQIGEQTVI